MIAILHVLPLISFVIFVVLDYFCVLYFIIVWYCNYIVFVLFVIVTLMYLRVICIVLLSYYYCIIVNVCDCHCYVLLFDMYCRSLLWLNGDLVPAAATVVRWDRSGSACTCAGATVSTRWDVGKTGSSSTTKKDENYSGRFPEGVQKEEIQQWRQARSRPGEKETINITLRTKTKK